MLQLVYVWNTLIREEEDKNGKYFIVKASEKYKLANTLTVKNHFYENVSQEAVLILVQR
jgi:hypothetical protein